MQEMSYDSITDKCIEALKKDHVAPLQLLETLMDTPGVPMHDPVHHYIMPSVLLTLAARSVKLDEDNLRQKLAVAEERARKLLPGFCGWWGACGAAVGCGVFASVWMGTAPRKEDNWAQINAFTAKCLAKVSSIDGPRCCKRTSFLALGAAIEGAKEIFGLDLGINQEPVCSWYLFNRECRKDGCPFYPNGANKIDNGAHSHLREGLGAFSDDHG